MKVLIGLAVAAAAMAQQSQAARGQEQLPMTEEGVASFYGWKLHGRRMANGRRFNALGTSAASRTLPLGCRVRVTNLANGRSVDLTIEDRGPYVSGRIIDLNRVQFGTRSFLIRDLAGSIEQRPRLKQPDHGSQRSRNLSLARRRFLHRRLRH